MYPFLFSLKHFFKLYLYVGINNHLQIQILKRRGASGQNPILEEKL